MVLITLNHEAPQHFPRTLDSLPPTPRVPGPVKAKLGESRFGVDEGLLGLASLALAETLEEHLPDRPLNHRDVNAFLTWACAKWTVSARGHLPQGRVARDFPTGFKEAGHG